MTAQEWLENLDGKQFSQHLDIITHSDDFGLDVVENKRVICGDGGAILYGDAESIVALCNAVPRLVEMVVWMAKKLEAESPSQVNEHNGNLTITPSSLEDWLEQAYQATEPRE